MLKFKIFIYNTRLPLTQSTRKTKTFYFVELNIKQEFTLVFYFGISALQSFQVLPIRQTFNYLCSFSRPKLSCYHQQRGHQRRRGKNFNRQNTEAGGDESMNISSTPHNKSARTFQNESIFFADFLLFCLVLSKKLSNKKNLYFSMI